MSRVSKLREEAKALRIKGYNLRTKKAKQKAFDEASKIKREALELLYVQLETFSSHSIKATVKDFTPKSEYFLVETPYGLMWLSPTNDVFSKSWYATTCCIEYAVGQEIIVEIKPEVNQEGLFIELLPVRIYGGQVNEIQYAELDKRTNLAFFKHSSGGMTGLFSKKR